MKDVPSPPDLSASPSFWEGLHNDEQRQLRDAAELMIYAPDERLVTVGRHSDTALVIWRGWVKITNIYPGTNPDMVGLRTAGDLVGENAAIGRARTATITAINEVRALVIPADHFREFLRLTPHAWHVLQETQSNRQIEAGQQLSEIGHSNASQRLAGLLLRLFKRAGREEGTNSDRRLVLDLPISQKELGEMVRTSRSTVERALKDWRCRGFILTDHRRLTLLNEPALKRIAPSAPSQPTPHR